MKSLYIAEKPSVAQEFGKALHENLQRRDGYLESENSVVTWCVGHLVTMSFPDRYDEKYRRWSMDTLPFLPEKFRYEVIPSVKKQFEIVSGLLNREDVGTIYVCTDSGREGEYIYRLVAMMAGVKDKKEKRVWIDSQTEEEILRGIREAKDLSCYNHLSDSAFLRAKEDYLMGINFSRALSLRYSYAVSNYLGKKYQAISVGRVMTCVLGMVVRREREIRGFQKMPFFRVLASFSLAGKKFTGEWRVGKDSRYFQSPVLYRENGFREKKDAEELIHHLQAAAQEALVAKAEKKNTKKNPPLLYNLAEIQNDCSKKFKISPDVTLGIIQQLYEKKLVTYPRTDARVLSSAIAKEIHKNLQGLTHFAKAAPFAAEILEKGSWKTIGKTRYTNDRQITDHYAIIPTGQGLANLDRLPPVAVKVYTLITERFLGIFYPPAVYRKISLELVQENEHFFAGFNVEKEAGYLKIGRTFSGTGNSAEAEKQNKEETGSSRNHSSDREQEDGEESFSGTADSDPAFLEAAERLRKGMKLPVNGYQIKEGETSPPKRYTSGSMILAMENAGQLIEDEELREQIKGSGIGTSATRAEILKKLVSIKYLALNKKTQAITPTQMGEMVYDVVYFSIRSLLNPDLTASWEKGLTYVAEGSIRPEEYMEKLERFVAGHTEQVKRLQNQTALRQCFDRSAVYYRKNQGSGSGRRERKNSAKAENVKEEHIRKGSEKV